MMNDADQLEEVIFRFKKLVPRIEADDRFEFGAYISSGGVAIPYVYAPNSVAADTLPEQFVYVLRRGEDEYHVRWEGLLVTTAIGWPIPCWPGHVAGDELDQIIIDCVWESHWAILDIARQQVEDLRSVMTDNSLPF